MPTTVAHLTTKGVWKTTTICCSLTQTGGFSPTCTYYQESHTSNSCPTVSNVIARKDILRKNGRCFLCLKRNHLIKDCNSKSRCFKCHGRHHISICSKDTNERKFKGSPKPLDGRHPEPEQRSQNQHPAGSDSKLPSQPTGEVTSVNFVSAKTPVLLQTAQATILRADTPMNTAKVRVVLDS